MQTDLLIIGGGVAALSCACSAAENGVRNIIVVEKSRKLGGVLKQCIHNGFGALTFNKELTGDEYAQKFIDSLNSECIKVLTSTTVLEIKFSGRRAYAISPKYGYFSIDFKALVVATGCYEEPAGSLIIPGSRPAGIMTAGTAQQFINIHGFLPGNNVVIFGTNIVGLTAARRLTLEGAKVLCVIENLPYCRGPLRDEYLCLRDFNIPVYYSHTITKIFGKKRIEKITVSQINKCKLGIGVNNEFNINLDCLLIAQKLIPENYLLNNPEGNIETDENTNGPVVDQNMQTTLPGIFACGNNVYVHNIVDIAVKEAAIAGKSAFRFIENFKENKLIKIKYAKIKFCSCFCYAVPQIINLTNLSNITEVYLKPNSNYKNITIIVKLRGETILKIKKSQVLPSLLEKVVLTKNDLLKLNEISSPEIFIYAEKYVEKIINFN